MRIFLCASVLVAQPVHRGQRTSRKSESWGTNSGHQTLHQVPSLSEPS